MIALRLLMSWWRLCIRTQAWAWSISKCMYAIMKSEIRCAYKICREVTLECQQNIVSNQRMYYDCAEAMLYNTTPSPSRFRVPMMFPPEGINTLKPKYYGHQITGVISKYNLLNENCCVLIQTSLKWVTIGQSNKNPAFGSEEGMMPHRHNLSQRCCS